MPVLSLLGALWGNPWTRLAMVGVLAFGFGWIKGFGSVPRVDVAALERNAIAGRDAVWESKLREQERQAEAELAEAIAERDASQPVPATDAELVKLCNASASCRNKGR